MFSCTSACSWDQTPNQKILLLMLTIDQTGDIGTDVIAYRPAKFKIPAEQGQYTQVSISSEGQCVLTLDVTEAGEIHLLGIQA